MSNEITKPNDVDDLVKFAASLSDETPVSETCKMCKSPLKKEAHEVYDKTNSVQSVVNFLKEKGEEIKYGSVRKHILNHYQVHQDELNIRELAGRLDKWGKQNLSDTAILSRWIKLFDMQATDLVAKVPFLPPDQQRKNLELASKLVAQVAAMKEQLNLLQFGRNHVEMVFKTLNQIIEVKVAGSPNPEIKRVLREVFDELNANIGDMPIEGAQED